MITVTKVFMFEASHRLPYYEGACHNLHGHSYKLEVTIGGNINDDPSNSKCGMIIDFKDLKKIVNDVAVERYDHSFLNEFFPNPTAEIMVKKISLDIMRKLPKNTFLVSCKLWETTTSYAEFNPMIEYVCGRLSSTDQR